MRLWFVVGSPIPTPCVTLSTGIVFTNLSGCWGLDLDHKSVVSFGYYYYYLIHFMA
jgi:hypothetical protein